VTTSLLNRPRIVAAAAALFQHGRRSPHYIRTIRALDAEDRALVQFASPQQVEEVRRALGVHPSEQR
jgi:hypothetical protein